MFSTQAAIAIQNQGTYQQVSDELARLRDRATPAGGPGTSWSARAAR